MVPVSAKPICHGGLLRCCIKSIMEYDGPEVPGVTGIPCRYGNCDDGRPTLLLATDGVWRWKPLSNLRPLPGSAPPE